MNKIREFKFRAWDGKRMIFQDQEIDIPGYGINFARIDFIMRQKQVMQFTGLQVKGVDLYESDILRSPHYKNQRGKQEYLYHEVKWNRQYHCWQAVSIGNEEGESIIAHGNPQLWIYIKNEGAAEVIGNIFEHPLLLTNDIQSNGASPMSMPIEQNDDKQNNL